jgi:hypothetical protein
MLCLVGSMDNVIYGDTLAISPEFQGRGYGKLFLKLFEIADKQQTDIAACSTAEGYPLYLRSSVQVIGHVQLKMKRITDGDGIVTQIPELEVPIIRRPAQASAYLDTKVEAPPLGTTSVGIP